MNKKTIALLLSAALCCSTAMTGCSESDSSSEGSDSSKAETSAAESKGAVESVAEESSAESTESEAEEAPKERPTNIVDGIDYLTFVSHGYKLPDDWEEKTEMVTFVNGQDYEVTIEKKAYDAYMKLKEELEADGIFIDSKPCCQFFLLDTELIAILSDRQAYIGNRRCLCVLSGFNVNNLDMFRI